jgi:hypothetical protein
MRSPAILLLCVGAAVGYGVLHNQVTARVCVEYFTIGHPPLFDTDDPTVLGLGWGILATWWVGTILGVLLILAARAGNRPPRSVGSLVRPVVLLVLVTGAFALVAGVIGWIAAKAGWFYLLEPEASKVPTDRHVAYLAVMWAHSASYLVGLIGGAVVCFRVWRSRKSASAT